MTPEQFAYWFQGFAELTPNPPDARQWDQIRAHLALVFAKVTLPPDIAKSSHMEKSTTLEPGIYCNPFATCIQVPLEVAPDIQERIVADMRGVKQHTTAMHIRDAMNRDLKRDESGTP